jgi:predicted DNA-binding antitoxin AbrB/MazE fold protein
MEKTVRAVYENGALHPLEPLLLAERQQVTVTIDDSIDFSPNHSLLVSPAEWSYAAHDDICLEEVRLSLANIHGSLSEAVLEERRER